MRIRTIKPEFFTHEDLFEAEQKTKLPLRVAFAGLWCACDREGRFKWEPRRLGVSILPYDKCEFSRVLDALATRGFIRRYRVNGIDYGCVDSFQKHQIVNNREKASEIPPPSESVNCEDVDASGTREARDGEVEKISLSGREGKGTGKEGNRKGRELRVEFPDSLKSVEGFDEHWRDFEQHRKEKREPLTNLSARGILKLLAERPAEANHALEIAIRRNWQGFEWSWIDKDKKNGSEPSVPAPKGVNVW